MKKIYFEDDINWLMGRFFSVLSNTTFTYKKEEFKPVPLVISPNIARELICPENCGACCGTITKISRNLDFLPSEDVSNCKKLQLSKRNVQVFHDGKEFQIPLLTDYQEYADDNLCWWLNRSNGRCNMRGQAHPFVCDLVPLSTTFFKKRPDMMITRYFGRGWAMRRVDGQKGAMCKIVGPSMNARKDVIRKLYRLDLWMTHFGFTNTKVPTIINWLKQWTSVPSESLVITPDGSYSGFFHC